MRIALINTYFDIEANGLRSISAALREAGHTTRMIFLPKTGDGTSTRYPSQVVRDVVDLTLDVELIGTTLMSNNFLTAEHLTHALRHELDTPVAWGGIHPTVRPEESIAISDYVCVGEGEGAAVDLANVLASGDDTAGIPNIWTRHDNGIHRNACRPLIDNLNRLPYPDYTLEDHFIIEGGRVIPMTHAHQERALLYRYSTSTSRGCILNCSFCCHNAYRKIYGNNARNIRRRSIEHVMGELEGVLEHMPYIRSIVVDDDSFMDASLDYIEEFSRQWKGRIKLPFAVTGVIPISVTEEKIAALVDAGLGSVRMGIQSGAQNTKRLYRRNIKDAVILRAVTIFDEHRSKIRVPNYDLILDNPWESDEDRIATLRLLQALPRPFGVAFYSLTLYPGTDLYDRARAEGLIQNDVEDIYSKDYLKVQHTYMNGIAFLFGAYRIPGFLERILLHPDVVKRKLDFLYWPLWILGWPLFLALLGVRHVFHGNPRRLLRWARLGLRGLRIRAATFNK